MPKKRPPKTLESCPNCMAIWAPGSEEWDWQKCDSCGWPDNEKEEDDLDDADYFDPEEDYQH